VVAGIRRDRKGDRVAVIHGLLYTGGDSATACPYEDLRDPGRLRLDSFGFVHICQGISLGNIQQTSLAEICAAYDPQGHPITGPLLRGGPAELVRQYGLPHANANADACHLCYESRRQLRAQFIRLLAPDSMYGE
jgi:hypothetical protein